MAGPGPANPDGPAGVAERHALTRRMLALAADPRCQNPPGQEGRAYLRTAEAEASRLTGPGDPALWRAAIEAWERVSAPHRIAYARLRLAEALLGRPGQRQQARAELAAASDIADRMGARALAEEAGLLAMRARLGSQAAGTAASDDRFGLTQREHDVLGLVCAGRTNRQIAAELFITPKTAGLHVSHILAKLSVTTRGEAAALAHRLGLVAVASASQQAAAGPIGSQVDDLPGSGLPWPAGRSEIGRASCRERV